MHSQAQAGVATEDVFRQRPILRGVSHLWAAIAATVGAPVLLLVAASPQAYVGGAIFAASLILLYSTSASYHLIKWRPAVRRIVRRLDHAMIFVLIAGTYTPLCLVAVSLAWGISILSVIWGVAGAGILLKLAWPEAPRWLGVTVYVTMGWLALVAAPELVEELTTGPLVLLVLGGALYTLGGVVYAAGRPRLSPQVFGYHEVFHLLVVAGSAVHYSLVAIYVLPS